LEALGHRVKVLAHHCGDGFDSPMVPLAWLGAPTSTTDLVCGWEARQWRAAIFSVH